MQLEADHAPEAGKEPAGALVARMRRQAGVVDAVDGRVIGEEPRDPQGGLVLTEDAQRQRLEAAVEQEAGVRVERAAEVVEQLADALHECPAAGHDPGGEVAVAVEVLRRAVQREVEAELSGPEVDGARERVVDHRDEAVLPGEGDDRLQVRDLHERVGDGLDVDGPGVGAQLRPPVGGVLAVDEGVVDAQAGQLVGDEGAGAAVGAIHDEQVVARPEAGEQAGRDRGHAAGGDQRRFGALERRELRVQRLVVGRVAEPHVACRVVVCLALIEERRRLEDGHRHRAVDPRLRLTRVHHGGGDRLVRTVGGRRLDG